jgi:hypothetical protein
MSTRDPCLPVRRQLETLVYQCDVNFTGDASDYTKRVLLKKIVHLEDHSDKQYLLETMGLYMSE